MASERKEIVREGVQRHRARMREQGMRPVQLWVADVRSSAFLAEARRQSEAVARSRHAVDDQAFVDDLSEGAWGP